jgi:hypothetical protein
MSAGNMRLVQESYSTPDGLIEQRDLFAGLAERITPSTEFDFTAAYPDRPVMRGMEEVTRFRDEGPWEELNFEAEEFFDVDDERVLVMVRVDAKGKGSGARVELLNAHEFTFRDGVLVRFKVYSDRDEGLAAVRD